MPRRPAPVIGRTVAESVPAHDPPPRPPAGAPNVLLVVLDDLGFAQLGCFGAAGIETPTIDRLAAEGLRFNRFHVTALCSPTRAALLTGRNHHAVGMGFLTDIPIGFPGYTGRIPASAATLPRILRDHGWGTFAVGKWHLTPRWEQTAAGPFTRWPLGLGFERFYGFLGGDTNQFAPELVADNHRVEPPRRPEDGYHLTEDLVEVAARMITDHRQAAPGRRFFCYLAPGATHAPHHAPRAWIDRYAGAFDDGWDAWRGRTFARQLELGIVPPGTSLTPRPPWVPAWEDLEPDHRRLFARMMECYAGFLTHTDAQLGRLLERLDELGCLDETLVIVCSDNGTSAEGGPHGSLNEHRFVHNRLDDLADTLARLDDLGGPRAYNHYPWGWAWAGNTPLRLWKRFTWLGGVRTPLVIRAPGVIPDPGAVRPQFCHAVDLAPTVYELAGIEVPEVVDGVPQQPVDGAGLRRVLTDPDAGSPRRTQYFEMLGSRAIYHDGWKATTDHVGNQLEVERRLVAGSHDFDTDHWALFCLDEDFSEAHDRSADEPDRLRALVELWWAEAGRNQVLPLDDSFIGRAVALEPAPEGPRAAVRLLPGAGPVHEDVLPPLAGGFTAVAELEVDGAREAEGMVCALGDRNGGWALYLLAGRPVAAFALLAGTTRLVAGAPLRPGPRRLEVRYERERGGGGPLRLLVDGVEVAATRLGEDLPFRWQIAGAGLLVGADRGLAVTDDYTPPFPCTARIRALTLTSAALAAAPGGRRGDRDGGAADTAGLVDLARALRHE